MAVRWTITFKTIKDRTGLVKVYDSSYSGDPIALTPAVNPFYVSQRQSELITPVMSDSGYLRVIDNGIATEYIEDIHPLAALDRKVEFFVDNTLVWCGYISPSTFSVPWEPAPREVEFPLVGALDVLASATITDTGVGRQIIATFLDQILTATGIGFTGVMMARQMLEASWSDDIPELRFGLSRYNFLKFNTAAYEPNTGWNEFIGESWLTVLEEICRYFGWTASAQGTLLVLTSPRTDITDYALVTRADLAAIENDFSSDIPYTQYERSEVSQLGWDGINHRKSISNGKRRITINAQTPAPEGIFPEILFNGDVEYSGSYTYSEAGQPTLHGTNKVLNIDHEHVTLHKYEVTDIGGSSEDYHEVDWEYPSDIEDMACPAAYIVKATAWGSTEPKQKNWSNVLRLGHTKAMNEASFYEQVPLASIESRAAVALHSGGAICISALLQTSYGIGSVPGNYWRDPSGAIMWSPLILTGLKCSLQIGSAAWNGSSWVGGSLHNPPIFTIPCQNNQIPAEDITKNLVSQIDDSNDIQSPYVGTAGYIVPVSNLEGKLKITFYNDDYDWYADYPYAFAALYIGNLKFQYNTGEEKTEEFSLTRIAGSFDEDLTVTLRLASTLDDRISQSLLWFQNNNVGDIEIRYPDSLTLYQPERWLMNTLLMIYSNPIEQLVLEVDFDSALNVYDFVSIGGKTYIITGRETDFADEHTKLTIKSYE